MTLAPRLVAPIALAAASACGAPAPRARYEVPRAAGPAPEEAAVPPGIDERALDPETSPCTDFYRYACGGWLRATRLPEGASSFSRTFDVIQSSIDDLLRGRLERGSDAPSALYASCMDEAAIARAGVSVLAPELARIDGVRDAASFLAAAGELRRSGVGAPFELRALPDGDEPRRSVVALAQGGLGLPRAAYAAEGERAAYEARVARGLGLLAGDEAAGRGAARAVVSFEQELAAATEAEDEGGDPRARFHPITREALKRAAPLPWDAYLAAAGVPEPAALAVAHPAFFAALRPILARARPEGLRAYLRWHLVRHASPLLDPRFAEGPLGAGAVPAPRWRRCVALVHAALPHAVTAPVASQLLDADGRQRVAELVAGLEAALARAIDGSTWMDDRARARAREKLARLAVRVGSPQPPAPPEDVRIDRGPLFANVRRVAASALARSLARGPGAAALEWRVSPASVNAYYAPATNEIVLPAGLLQPPLFSPDRPRAALWGSIGMMAGHELTHALDAEGRYYGPSGQLEDWWSPDTARAFAREAACLDDRPSEGRSLRGSAEDLADLGGITLAYAAYQADASARGGGAVAAERQFFLGFAQAWCAVEPSRGARDDAHSMARDRVNRPLGHLPAFAATFRCGPGAPMVRSARCRVW